MNLPASVLDELREQAVQTAQQAAALIARTAPSSLEVECKPGAESRASEVVSQLDRDVEKVILEQLADSVQKYDLGMLAEESEHGETRLHKPAFWCVDPLDGTLPFLEGRAGYAVSIALVDREGIPLLGIVADPVTGDLFSAQRNKGAWCNGQAFQVKGVGPGLKVYVDMSMTEHRLFAACMEQLNPVKVYPPVGAVMNVCNMLRDAPGCYFKFPKKKLGGGSLWDYAATACITREAGGVVTDLFGDPLDLNRKDSTYLNHRGFIYATDPTLHQEVRELALKLWEM